MSQDGLCFQAHDAIRNVWRLLDCTPHDFNLDLLTSLKKAEENGHQRDLHANRENERSFLDIYKKWYNEHRRNNTLLEREDCKEKLAIVIEKCASGKERR